MKSVTKGRSEMWVGGGGVGVHIFEGRACEALVAYAFRCKTGPQNHWPGRCMQVAVNGKYEPFLPSCQAHAPAPTPHPQSALFCAPKAFVPLVRKGTKGKRGSNSTWCNFVCRHGSQTWGVPNSPFQGLSEYAPYNDPPTHTHTTGHTMDTNQATMTTATKNLPSWRIRY